MENRLVRKFLRENERNNVEFREFAESIDFSPLKKYVKELLGVDLEISIEDRGEYSIRITSNSLLDDIGIMKHTFKTMTLSSFNSSMVKKEEGIFYWGNLNFSYDHLDGGSNGSKVMSIWYKDNRWIVRPVIDDTAYLLDKRGRATEYSGKF